MYPIRKGVALRIIEGSDLEEDEMAMITKDFKKYLMRGKDSSRSGGYSEPRVTEKQTNEGCYKCGKTDHHIKNCPQWEIEWKKERAERRNGKKEHVHPKKNKGSTKAMIAAWGGRSDEDSDDEDGDEQALMAIGESDEEFEVQVKGSIHIWYMDSGFSKRMIGSKSQFLSLEDLKGGNVSFGNRKKESVHVDFDETNILSERREHNDEAIRLVRNLNETTAQTEAALKEGICDGTGSSTQSNMTGGTIQRGNDPQTSMEHVHEFVPHQQNTEGTSRGNQLVVKPYKYQSSHPIENIITDLTPEIKTRYSLKNICAFDTFLSLIEPKMLLRLCRMQDAGWVNAINKLDKDGAVTRNKARLVVQGYSQEEGICYDGTFTPVARLEAIRLLIAFPAYMEFTLHQMDIKSAFLNGYLKEEVFVRQPPGFENKESPDHVYKLDKALYGLKQAPRACYERLSKFLLEYDYK
ncbi:uncharacterized protein [Nicotiana tomentosiformis]|uniref:uncharacterized protein n=1 Tax=Nicotiana tomentosiformis TaxID=4098 RepID=UPI00388C920A